MVEITLGSGSPRRYELLNKLNLKVNVKPPTIDEEINGSLSIKENAIKLALDKLNEVRDKNPEDEIILTADTFIAYNNNILGKPRDREDAFNMLSMLSGVEHRVLTGYSIYFKKNDKTISDVDITKIKFKILSKEDIDNYLNLNEWQDAAGSYKIQGLGEILVENLNGSYSSVMGLPISRIYGILISQNLLIR